MKSKSLLLDSLNMEDQEIIIKSVDDEISQLQKLIADVGNKIKELESQKDHCKRLLQGFEWYTAHLKGEEIDTPELQKTLEI